MSMSAWCSPGALTRKAPSPSSGPLRTSCRCSPFHVFRFPTARWRPEAARPNPALGARPCRAAEISELEHLRVQSLPQPDQDRPSAEATRQRLLGHQPPCCPAATFPVFQGFETQAEMVPKVSS